MQSVSISTSGVSSNRAQARCTSIQHHVIKFVRESVMMVIYHESQHRLIMFYIVVSVLESMSLLYLEADNHLCLAW
jgi:hypothetical protein